MEIDEISEEWSADDWVVVNYDFEKQNEWDWGWSWGNWVMNAGKKVLMAGIVISSAPVLLPPILLLSAIGAAVSVPSGVVLASYACTHKLMTKLLPPPPPPLPLKYYDEEEEEDDEVKMSEDVKNEVEMRIELVEDDEKYNQVGREMSSSSSSSSSSSEDEDSAHVEEIQVKKELVLRDVDDGKQGNNHGVVDVKVNVNVKQDELKKVLKEEKDEPKKVLKEEKDEPKKVLKEEKDEPKKVLKEEKDEPKKVLKEEKDTHGGVNGGFHSHEEPISEEKIWEKIDAIRVIVGFKAPKRSSYVEEVKALYRFTGIQPPTPTEDQSHLSHLNFLMSVIGLK